MEKAVEEGERERSGVVVCDSDDDINHVFVPFSWSLKSQQDKDRNEEESEPRTESLID